MDRGRVLLLIASCGGASALALMVARWDPTTPPPAAWPRVVGYELTVDLTEPARFRASARVKLADVREREVPLLLNRSLTVDRAEVDGRPVEVFHLYRLPGRYHREARVVVLALDQVPPDGGVEVDLRFAGDAERGTDGSDWRGILYVGETEARMSEQTVFYPQVPLDLEGPAIALAPFQLTVVAPARWEVFAPLPQLGVEREGSGARWRFAGDRPQRLSILGGERQRRVARVAGTEVVTLLRDEHAALAEPLVAEATGAMQHFAARFGAVGAGSLGVFEMSCRSGSSYNWMSEGVMAIDRHALGHEVPVHTLAHEVAHLWWGQAVPASGPGERFLTEGMAEYSAWTYLQDTGRGELLHGEIGNAQSRIAELVEAGASAALDSVGFGHDHYTDLAYGKGPLVLRALRGQLAPGVLDRALAQLVADRQQRPATLDDLLGALRKASGLAELRVPWLAGSGDLELELTAVDPEENHSSCTLAIRCTRATPRCTVDPRGAPVGVLLGGVGWSRRHTVLLAGEETRVRCDGAGSPVTYARLDPDGAWPRPPRQGTIVLDGARLLASEPAPGASVRPGGQTIRLTFDRELAPVELDALRAAQAGAGGAGVHALSIQQVKQADEGRTLAVKTAPWLPGRRYRVLLTSLADRGGTPAAATALEFDALASDDRTPPRIVASAPASGATVEPGPIEVWVAFDEPMRIGQGFSGTAVEANRRRGREFPDFAAFGAWDDDFRTITWLVPAPKPGTTYCVPFVGGLFRDLAGNGATDFELVFTVAESKAERAKSGR